MPNFKKSPDHTILKRIGNFVTSPRQLLFASLVAGLLVEAGEYVTRPNPPSIAEVMKAKIGSNEYAKFREGRMPKNMKYYTDKGINDEIQLTELSTTLTNLDILVEKYQQGGLTPQELLGVIATSDVVIIAVPGTYLSLESATHDGRSVQENMKTVVSSGIFPALDKLNLFEIENFVVKQIPGGGGYDFSFKRPQGSFTIKIGVRTAPNRNVVSAY